MGLDGRRYQRLQRVAAGGPGKGRGDELQVYGDFLRIVLEIFNCIIVTNLPSNPELVYALLHRQEVFMPFRVRSGTGIVRWIFSAFHVL